jgi:hypothetical protein
VAGVERETVTDLAAAPPEPPPPTRRSRLGHYLAMAAVLIIVAAAAWLILVRFKDVREYRAEVEAILGAMTSGKPDDAEAVYNAASPRLKQIMILDAFVDLADRMHQTLGGFERIVTVSEVAHMSTVAGRAVQVKLDLRFARATSRGELSFLYDGERKEWVLLGVMVDIPPHLEGRAAELEAQAERLRAPDVVIEAVERICRLLQEGRIAEIHGAAAPAFKTTVSEEALRHLTEQHSEELGGFVGLVKVLSSAQHKDKNRARVQALLEYHKRRTTGTFEFQQLDDEWHLLAFKVNVPEPFSPLSGPPDPEL